MGWPSQIVLHEPKMLHKEQMVKSPKFSKPRVFLFTAEAFAG